MADGSLELLIRRAAGLVPGFFEVESYRTHVDATDAEATVKLRVDGERVVETGEGNGPVNALDAALRKALRPTYPDLDRVHLTDYKVRVIDSTAGTAAITRVLIDSTDGERSWTTIGVGENVITASWEALVDSLTYALVDPSPTV